MLSAIRSLAPRRIPSWPVLGLLLAGCTTAQIATATAAVDTVLTDVQNVCGAVIDDSTGTVETLIKSFPLGTTALAIADTVCTYIDSVPPLPVPASSARLLSRAKTGAPLNVPLQKVTVNGVTIGYAKTSK